MKLEVKIIITHKSGEEAVPAKARASRYDPELIGKMIVECLREAQKKLRVSDISELKRFSPEISIATSDLLGSAVRPAMHLDPDTLKAVARCGASLDFDPY